MYIVETLSELKELRDFIEGKNSYWFPMWVDFDLHPLNTELSFIFIQCDGSDYILPHKHVDTLRIDLEGISDVLLTKGDKWVFQTKKFLNTLKIPNLELYDIDTAWFLKTSQTIDYRTPFESLLYSWKTKGYYDNLIKSIPILKLGEIIQTLIPNYTDLDDSDYNFYWYNSTYIPLLSELEQNGVRVGREKFTDRWSHASKHISSDNKVYTEYNPFTVTGRPSNRYGGVNFSALNKSDGSRECFVSDGIFLQMDYDAYHPRIIGKLIGYPLPQTSVHRWLSEQYGTSYEEGKGVTFQLLYGGIPTEFLEIPYFKGVDDYIKELWVKVQRDGYLTTLKRRIPLSWIDTPNPQKVFNYLLQAVETELNVDKLGKIIPLIRNTDVKFVLYTYDSFLLDYPLDYPADVARRLKGVIEGGGFPIKASWGTDYSKV
jgi:hypothetical protein